MTLYRENVKEMDNVLEDITIELFDKCREYFNEFAKQYGKKGFIWVKNNETKELIIYTRGEYENDLMNFLEYLDKKYDA